MFVLMDQTQGTLIYLKILSFGNTFEVDTNVTINKTTTRDSKLKKQAYFPDHNIFGFSFTTVTDAQVEDFKDFIEKFAAEPIWLFDTTDTWRYGFIQEDEIPITTNRDGCSHSFSFTFLEITPPPGVEVLFTPPPDPNEGVSGIGLYNWSDDDTSLIEMDEFLPNGLGTWTQKADMPSPGNKGSGSAPLQGKVLSVGGTDDAAPFAGAAIGECLFYTPAPGLPGDWAVTATIPSGHHKSDSVCLNIEGIVYSINGQGGDDDDPSDLAPDSRDLLIFDGSWTVGNRPPASVLSRRTSHMGASIDGNGYVVGGTQETAPSTFDYFNDTVKFTPNDTWITQLDYPETPVGSGIANTGSDFYDGTMVVVGGARQPPNLPTARLLVFTPSNFTPGTWAEGSPVPPEAGGSGVSYYKPTTSIFKVGIGGIAEKTCHELQGGPFGSWVQKTDSNIAHKHSFQFESPFGDPSA